MHHYTLAAPGFVVFEAWGYQFLASSIRHPNGVR